MNYANNAYFNNYTDFIEHNRNNTIILFTYSGIHFTANIISMAIGIDSRFFAKFMIKFYNCNIAIGYFNNS